MSKPETTSWMWASGNGGTNGATIDTVDHMIQWFDEVGCACGDSVAVQSFEQFRQAGPMLDGMPEDVHEEIMTVVTNLEEHRHL